MVKQVDRVVAIRDGKTSTETIRRVSQLEQAIVGEKSPQEAFTPEEHVTYHEYVVLDSAGRLQLPEEYRERYHIGDRAELEMADDGILIRPVTGQEGESTAGQPAMAEQVSRLFADEKPPEQRKRFFNRLGWKRK